MKPWRICVFLFVCLAAAAVAVWQSERYRERSSEQTFSPDGFAMSDTILLFSADSLPSSYIWGENDSTQAAESPYRRLQPFYDALAYTAEQSVRVVHYGDSQLEGDRMTFPLRRALQARLGGGGMGLLSIDPTVDSRSSLVTLRKGNQTYHPTRFQAYGPASLRRNSRVYGPLAQAWILPVEANCTLRIDARTKGSEGRFTRLRIVGSKDSLIHLQDTVSAYLLPLPGGQDIYGVSAETPTGVQVDNVAMRGCAGTIFTGMDSIVLHRYFDQTRTRLIIWQFGGNVVPYVRTDKQIEHYIRKVREQIRYLHRLAPESAILIIGPSDMLTRENGQRVSYRVLPRLDEALRQAADEEEAAYWSLYEAMGGAGSMSEWMNKGWAGKDGIHFTRIGADEAGQRLADFLLQPL